MKRLFYALLYSFAGLAATFRSEPAFRLEVFLSIILIPLAFQITPIPLERIALLGSMMLVLVTEIMNTAIEATIDRIGTDIHPLSKKAKDAGSAMVFLALINSGIIWSILILGQHPG